MDIFNLSTITIFLLAILHGPVSSTHNCTIKDDSLINHQKIFRQMIQGNHNQLIFIYLEMFGIYEIADNDFKRNRMAEWIWVTQDYKHLLRYPMDIDLYTFGLLRSGTENFHLQVEIENVERCKKSSLTNFPYKYLKKIVNNQGKGMLCHRYFENQGFKLFLFNISHVSIGYDFECFSDNLNETKYEIVTKSPIIYITIAIVVIFISFYPAFVSIAVHDEQEHRHVKFYTKADHPYTLRRLFLFTLFHNTSHTVVSVFRFTFLMLLIGISFFCVKLIVKASCDTCFPTDKRKYPRVFDLTTGESEENILTVISLSVFFLLVLHILNYTAFAHFNTEDHVILFDLTNMCLPSENAQRGINVKILRFIPVHYFTSNDESTNSVFSQIVWRYKQLASLYFWSKIFLFPMRNYTKIKRKGCKFIYVILNLFLIFPINIFVFVSCTLCPLINFLCLQSLNNFEMLFQITFDVIRIIQRIFYPDTESFGRVYPTQSETNEAFNRKHFVLFAIFNFYPWFFMGLLYIYFVDNCFTYGLLYFLQTIMYTVFAAMPHLLSTYVHIFVILFIGISYILYFIVSFYKKYREILLFILDKKGTQEISVDHFDKMTTMFFPLRNAVFVLIAKSFFTVLFVIIIYVTFGYVHLLDEERDNDFNIFFPLIASVFAPRILEKYCLESTQDQLHRKEKQIKELLDFLSEHNNLNNKSVFNKIKKLLDSLEPQNNLDTESIIEKINEIKKLLNSLGQENKLNNESDIKKIIKIKKLLDSLVPGNNLDNVSDIEKLNQSKILVNFLGLQYKRTIEGQEFQLQYVFPSILCRETGPEKARLESIKDKKYSKAFCDEVFQCIVRIPCQTCKNAFNQEGCEECCAFLTCEEQTDVNAYCNCPDFSSEICACLPLNCINKETKQCACCYTLVEIPPGYQAMRSSSDDDSENEIRNEHIFEERESTRVKIPQSASQLPDNEISHLSNRSYQNMLQGDDITIV